MKQLYYNPIEIPEKVKIKSTCFNIDVEYDTWQSDGKPVYMNDLFDLAKSRAFEDVQVYLTSHNGAYVKANKKALVGDSITGWISLSDYGNGGGYLEDKYCIMRNSVKK